MVSLQAEQWRRVGHAIFMAAGATESNAARVAESLVDSNLAGHDSHGVMRIPQYIEAIDTGQVEPAGEPSVIKETACSALVDGAWTFGQVGAAMAMKQAIARAAGRGMAVAALVRAYHIGRLGEYSEMAHDAGMIGMVMGGGFSRTGSMPRGGVVPFGGAREVFGTNPFSIGLPAGSQPPVVADFATSAIAAGKIAMAREKGEILPPGCILDREGRPSTDPEDYYTGGMLLPFGGHKGYGLAVAIELLSQALTGADGFCDEKRAGGNYSLAGNLFIAIDPGLFRPFAEYAAAADATIRRVKSVPPAAGVDEVLLPGEPEQRSRARVLKQGISVPNSIWERMLKVSARFGVDIEAMMA